MNTIKKSENFTLQIILLVMVVLLTLPGLLYCQAPQIQWQKCFGGDSTDAGNSIIQTKDGGYAVAGTTQSSNGDVTGSYINDFNINDAWVVKVSSSGALEWQKCFGGTGDDVANCIIQTFDGGYVVAGMTSSSDGDVTGNHGSYDAWVIKFSSSGTIEWQKCLGGKFYDQAASIIQTSDGGYALTGYTESRDGDVSGNHGSDIWVVKLNASGAIQWQKCFGGTYYDASTSIVRTFDQGYVISGYTESSDGDVTGHHTGGNYDYDAWIVKIDSMGTLQWQKCLGGNQDDVANSIVQISDSGYVFAGYTSSVDGDVVGYHFSTDSGSVDYWVVKLDSKGNIVWQRCLGGSADDRAQSVTNTADNGVAIAGFTESVDGDVTGNHGNTGYDVWVADLNSSGALEWEQCYGGKDGDEAYSIIQSSDRGLAFTGTTKSNNDGDVSGFHGGTGYDIWLVKLNAASGVQNIPSTTEGLNLSTYPNPAMNNITLGFDLPKSSALDISIYNITGEKLQEINRAEQPTGHNEINLDVSKFSNGTYFVKVMAGGLSETNELEVMR